MGVSGSRLSMHSVLNGTAWASSYCGVGCFPPQRYWIGIVLEQVLSNRGLIMGCLQDWGYSPPQLPSITTVPSMTITIESQFVHTGSPKELRRGVQVFAGTMHTKPPFVPRPPTPVIIKIPSSDEIAEQEVRYHADGGYFIEELILIESN
jgi:hypothetical protein